MPTLAPPRCWRSCVTTALEQVASALDLNYDEARRQLVLAKLADVMDKYASRCVALRGLHRRAHGEAEDVSRCWPCWQM